MVINILRDCSPELETKVLKTKLYKFCAPKMFSKHLCDINQDNSLQNGFSFLQEAGQEIRGQFAWS